MWSAISGAANIASLAFAPGFYPAWYFLLVAAGYALLLPAIANLHVRHQPVRSSGTILGTAAGTASVAVGLAASASADLVVAALFVRGMWWWTIGKLWAETRVMPRPLGIATLAFGALAIATAVATAPFDIASSTLWMMERLVLGLWGLALAFALWRAV
jgi:hypothetical protein